MLTNHKALYAAFKSKDTRFDGRFFVAIASSGVYCRPVCRAKMAKPENCAFYATAAEAEQAGYRPCLLCRPELAPISRLTNSSTENIAAPATNAITDSVTDAVAVSITDASATLAYQAARILDETCGRGHSLEAIANRLGCSTRHLRRVFTAEYHVSPIQYVQTCRLLLAKNLLVSTNLSILEVALASGFGSQRRFNDVFKKHYRLSPSKLRKQPLLPRNTDNSFTLALGYRPPYHWDDMLAFLATRAIVGVEKVSDGTYMRTVRHTSASGERHDGWIRVGHLPQKNLLSVTMSDSLLSVLPRILAGVRHLFDLQCNPHVIFETLRAMNTLRPDLFVLGTRVPGCFNAFEMATRAVLGQQITVKAASTLASRLVASFGTPLHTGIDGLTHTFPQPTDILALTEPIENHLGPLGVIVSRAQTIYEIARLLATDETRLEWCPHPEEAIQKLMSIRGIGKWTAHYIAMRAMQWPDAFLETDAGVKKALPEHTPKELLAIAESWRPWRSYATMSLWNSL